MKTNKIKDERIEAVSNKIYKWCFYILCAAIFLDLTIKLNLWSSEVVHPIYDKITGQMISSGRGVNDFPFIIAIGLEALFLLGAFFTNVFMLARKGISFGASDLEVVRFPKKRYALISSCVSTAVTISCSVIRVIVYFTDGNFASSPNRPLDFIVISVYTIFIFLVAFVLFFLIFYIAFRLAKRNLKKYSCERTNNED